MLEPIRDVVWARRLRGGVPERGARDQYMPLAGAGETEGAFVGEGKGGKGMYGPDVGAPGRCEDVDVLRFGAGEGPECGVLGAMADVERRLRGLEAVGFVRFGEEVDVGAVGVEVVGGERGISGRGVVLPFLRPEGDLGLFGEEESFCGSD